MKRENRNSMATYFRQTINSLQLQLNSGMRLTVPLHVNYQTWWWVSEWVSEWVREWVREWGSEWVSEWVTFMQAGKRRAIIQTHGRWNTGDRSYLTRNTNTRASANWRARPVRLNPSPWERRRDGTRGRKASTWVPLYAPPALTNTIWYGNELWGMEWFDMLGIIMNNVVLVGAQ